MQMTEGGRRLKDWEKLRRRRSSVVQQRQRDWKRSERKLSDF